MALTLANTITVINDGENMIVEDTTVYGGSNADRDHVYINFLVLDMRNDPPTDITPEYDPEVVEQILVTTPHDGWYKITMSLTPIPDTPPPTAEPDELVKDELISARFCICKANFAKKVFNCRCGCENSELRQELYCLTAQLEGIVGEQGLVSQNDMRSADMAIERLNKECALANKPCC